ncbi:MAG: xanthine dehydrogenase molybdopterin binding subunit [Zoogloea sp.]|uniref:xanthine dehydrogenase molybdopterin binding subunit n=1 Tax=Zoogloea sp. TaxID=49181 RepID=UPI00261863AD|nr:xanthine dehydrogenase molybdopterin binding subunit [Zoogloea sp.]MDD3329191.1 xanthine dehydrogenase molybdopterin binding subunit [Zoogloea sp.]
MSERPIQFWFRGAIRQVEGAVPTRSLLDWLREDMRATGTKEGCAEGDCGACTVVLGEAVGGSLQLRALNACIRLLPTLDGKALFTVEDLATLAGPGHLHPVQQALASGHGSQCGFCTPGFAMSLFAVYENHPACPSRTAVIDALAGNLCRCTGYRPIVDALPAAYRLPPVRLDRGPILAALAALATLPLLDYRAGGRRFLAPRNLAELAAARLEAPDARLVAGATDLALTITKALRDPGDLLWLGAVPELATIHRTPDGGLVIGAAASLADAFAALVAFEPGWAELARRFAGPPVRHAGTLGGNIANGSPIGDSMPGLIALGARLVLRQGARQRRLPLEDFYPGYRQTALAPGEFIEAVELPPAPPGQRFRCWKVSKRHDQDISALCGAFAIALADGRVSHARIAFGGMAATPARARATEAALVGQPRDETTLEAASAALATDFTPLTDLRASAAYRRQAAAGLLRRLWLDTRGTTPLRLADLTPAAPPTPAAAETAEHRPPPIGQPLPHESAHLHVAGSAAYTDDLPEPAGTLHAAVGLSEIAHGRLIALDLSAVRAAPGVRAVITAADIPGENDCGPVVHDDPILAAGEVLFHGQPLFAVAADTRDAARRAARLAVAHIEPLPALLDIDAAIEAGSEVLPPVELRRGDVEAAITAAPHRLAGRVRSGGQEHYYLEGQVACAIPREDDSLHLLSSTQHPTEMQQAVAGALGWRMHQVSCECRRMGGGFGGKEAQSAQWACIAALLAQASGRPVKLRLDRDDDMRATGKRHDFRIDYDVGFDATGRIVGLRLGLASRCGFSADLSGPVNDRAVFHADNAYYLDAVAIRSLRCRTHTVSNTAFRGFGGPQGMFAIETVIDDIARHLGLDPLAVRRANFYAGPGRDITPYGMRVEDNILAPLVERLAESADYARRRAEIDAFNAASPVLKRGLALTPVKFGISFTNTFLNQAGALVHVYKDGSVRVSHGGTEMGQGLHTKLRQIVAAEFGLAVGDVRLSATDTTRVPNTSATAASSGSDLNGKAAQAACRAIRGRLAAFVAGRLRLDAAEVRFEAGRVRAPGFDAPFAQVTLDAWLARVQLWDAGFYATPKLSYDASAMRGRPFYYFAYGAAVSEAAIDTLTGEHRLLRVDILHDAGQSINPAIDIGQIEGGFIQGLGWLTSEELVFGPDGALLTHSPSTYKIPTAADLPPVFKVQLWDQPNREDAIHRAKAVGEPPLMLALSAFFALRDAVAAALGPGARPQLDAPATPEAILRALHGGTLP